MLTSRAHLTRAVVDEYRAGREFIFVVPFGDGVSVMPVGYREPRHYRK